MANPYDQFMSDETPADRPATKPPSPLDSALAAERVSGPVADLARSIYQQESSSGRNTQTSNAGAVGGMQIIPATFKSVADPDWNINDPEHNARAGVRYVGQMYERAGGDPALAAAGYYGGPGGLEKARQGIAVSDPRNPKAPNTLEYGQQVAARLPAQSAQAAAAVNPYDQFINQAQPPAKASAEPNPYDQFITSDKAAKASAPAAGDPSSAAPMPQRTASFLHGLMDPIAGASQLLTKVLPDSVNGAMAGAANWISDKTGGALPRMPEGGIDQEVRKREQAYEQSRANNGDTGFDGYRVLGNVLNPVNAVPGAGVARLATFPRIAASAGMGAASSALAPVDSDNFAGEKIKQVGMGAVAGGLTSAAGSGIARLISPNASKNADLQLLKAEGVNPTIGQTLGGWANRTEEKLQSVPILGDMISRARGAARDEFNTAAINRATAPIGANVTGSGQEAVKQAGDALSDAYNSALSQVQHVPLDQQFHGQLGQLQQMSQSLVPDMSAKFNKTLSDVVLGRVGPQGSMLGTTYKDVDSELGRIASRYGKSQTASEQEYGDAVKQLQSLLNQQMRRTNPQVARTLQGIDEGWANLVRVEGAAKAAHNAEGVFTPAQLNAAIRGADDSVRGRAVSRGTALMQDLGNAGQQVLGNKVPNSGTADRMWAGAGALATGAINPGIPAALIAGGAAYTRPVQSILSAAVSARPAAAEPAAGAISHLIGGLSPTAAQGAVEAANLGRKPARRQGFADGGLIGEEDPGEGIRRMTAWAEQEADYHRKENAQVVRQNEALALEAMGEDVQALGYKNGGMIGDPRKGSAIRALAYGTPTAVNPRLSKGKGKGPRIAS